MKNHTVKRAVALTLSAGIAMSCATGCGSTNEESSTNASQPTTKQEQESTTQKMPDHKELTLTIDDTITYQTIESFGASGAWWSQDVGGWDKEGSAGYVPREEVAKLLFSKEEGIGLSSFRYNIGAGTADSPEQFSGIGDKWRRAQSFETAPGIYDWTRDANAVWFLDKAVEYGVPELVFFANSPLTRLTKNGKGCGEKYEDGSTSNLAPENYRAHVEYVLDVVEHFKNEGYPVKFVSPINEPQWEWTGGQEGCHFSPSEVVAFLNTFLDVMEERNIEGVELSAPELGEWGNTSFQYLNAIYNDERLREELPALDIHSYWSDASAKTAFLNWLNNKNLNNMTLRMSEWCEMVNGRNTKMESALVLAETVHTDLTKLNVVSWQYWIAVSCYDYRDGLLYVNLLDMNVIKPKRLWAMGNFSRFIRPGFTRIEASTSAYDVLTSSYTGTDEEGEESIVTVLINKGKTDYKLDANTLPQGSAVEVYVTDAEHGLELVTPDAAGIIIPAESVVTIKIIK